MAHANDRAIIENIQFTIASIETIIDTYIKLSSFLPTLAPAQQAIDILVSGFNSLVSILNQIPEFQAPDSVDDRPFVERANAYIFALRRVEYQYLPDEGICDDFEDLEL